MAIPGAKPGAVEDFLVQLESLPWFRNIGKATPDHSSVKRLYAWEDWPGPEEPSVFELAQRQQAVYDNVMRLAGAHHEQFSALRDRIHAIVFRIAAPAVPYDPTEDAWHAPTAAVWQAAFTAGLVGLCIKAGQPIPAELQAQWEWFSRGHWPSGYASVSADDQLGPLLVY